MEKKNILRVCALGLCAATVFTGNTIKEFKFQNKTISAEKIVYKSGNITDKKVVDIQMTGSANSYAYIYGVNKNGDIVWDKELHMKKCSDNEYWFVNGYLGSKYYYLQYNGRLYVIDIQTGKEISSSYNGFHRIPEGVGYSIRYMEVENKLFEIYGLEDKMDNVAVYDINKGNVLKSVNNIEEKYIPENYVLDGDSIRYEDGMVVINMNDKYTLENDESIYKKYLRIDINNYKIYNSTLDKKVVDIKMTGSGNSGVGVFGLNKFGELVWFKMFKKNNSYDVLGNLGTNNYYLYNNNKLYALNIQTGQIVWSSNVPSSSYEEVGNKIAFFDVDNSGIYIYDAKTGKSLKSVKNVIEKYVGKTNKEATIRSDSHYQKDGVLYVEVDSLKRSNTGTGYSLNHMIGYLKIDVNSYKISFVSEKHNEISIWK